MSTFISFFVGVASSLAAAGLIFLRARARYRLRFPAVMRLIENLAERIRKDNYHFDYIVTVGRSGGVAGSILAGEFGLIAPVAITPVKTRLPDGDRTIELDPASRAALQGLAGRRLLVFICCNDTGVSLKYVLDELLALSPPPLEVRTAALYTSPSPLVMPRYTGVVLEKESSQSMSEILAGLPWVNERWLQPFGAERGLPPVQ